MRRNLFFIIFMFLTSFSSFATEEKRSENENEIFDPIETIMHHISDAHSWHIVSWEDKNGGKHDISIPLPVILYYNGQIYTMLSSEFGHGDKLIQKGDVYLKMHHEKIYITNKEGNINIDHEGDVLNKKPLDFSITRNVASMWLSVLLLIWIFILIAKRYKPEPSRPRGIQSLLEPIILFVRDDIAITQIGTEKSNKYLPFLLTIFFFIWINNLLGLMPFFPGGSNLTGNIAMTMVLATITFIITNINGSKTYWKHILLAPGVPFFVKIFLVPVEIIGMITKPFALMIRLFANITAGHIIILSLMSLVFVMKSYGILGISIPLTLVMFCLELLVAALQAYIFTLLSALFIGMAIHNEEH